MRLLLDDRFAPITSTMAFLELGVDEAVRAFVERQVQVESWRRVTLGSRPIVAQSLEEALTELLPLTNVECKRYLFVPTKSRWTAFFENDVNGTDAFSTIGYLVGRTGARGLRLTTVPHTLRSDGGRHGAAIFELYAAGEELNVQRVVSASNDGGRWRFDEAGEELDFEEVESYRQERKIRNKLTAEMLQRYAKHLGLEPFDDRFFLPEGEAAILIEKYGDICTDSEEFSLEEARTGY